MPTRPLDIINCTLEELFHQMVITKNIFKDTFKFVSNSRGYMHCITTLSKLSAGRGPGAVDNKGKARLHLKYIDLGIMS